jgi:hypothetical protein
VLRKKTDRLLFPLRVVPAAFLFPLVVFWDFGSFAALTLNHFLDFSNRDTDFAPAGIAPASISDIDWHLCSIP